MGHPPDGINHPSQCSPDSGSLEGAPDGPVRPARATSTVGHGGSEGRSRTTTKTSALSNHMRSRVMRLYGAPALQMSIASENIDRRPKQETHPDIAVGYVESLGERETWRPEPEGCGLPAARPNPLIPQLRSLARFSAYRLRPSSSRHFAACIQSSASRHHSIPALTGVVGG